MSSHAKVEERRWDVGRLLIGGESASAFVLCHLQVHLCQNGVCLHVSAALTHTHTQTVSPSATQATYTQHTALYQDAGVPCRSASWWASWGSVGPLAP